MTINYGQGCCPVIVCVLWSTLWTYNCNYMYWGQGCEPEDCMYCGLHCGPTIVTICTGDKTVAL